MPFSLAVSLSGLGCRAANHTLPHTGESNSADSLHWVSYTDNAEGAFSIDIPTGFQVVGGMYRFGYFDVRWMIDVRSLDGKVIIRIDDPNVPPYVQPGPHTGPAGHPAVRPNMYQMVVDNYRDAHTYAQGYAQRRFAATCSALTPRSSNWTPSMPVDWQLEPGVHSTEASLAYDCATSNGARIVNVYARDSVHGKDGLWIVDPVISIVATPDTLALAQQMVQHMIDSWRETPQWKLHQDQMTQMGLEAIRTDFGHFMQQMQAYHQQREAAMNQQVSQFESRQNAQAAQVSSWKHPTGLTNVSDPATGTQFQVFSGPKANYYMDGLGNKSELQRKPRLELPSSHQRWPVILNYARPTPACL